MKPSTNSFSWVLINRQDLEYQSDFAHGDTAQSALELATLTADCLNPQKATGQDSNDNDDIDDDLSPYTLDFGGPEDDARIDQVITDMLFIIITLLGTGILAALSVFPASIYLGRPAASCFEGWIAAVLMCAVV